MGEERQTLPAVYGAHHMLTPEEKGNGRKISKLKDGFRATNGALVAFSAGVDSTFLLKVAHGSFGPPRYRTHRVFADGSPPGELRFAEESIRFFDAEIRKTVVQKFKEVGFSEVSLDLRGGRTGTMNEPVHTQST